jgi:hypothetical protein
MEFLQILILAILAMAGLAALRLVRVLRFRRTPLPDGPGRTLFLLGFVLVPPIALGGPASVPVYVGVIAALVIVMWIAAVVIELLTASRTGQLVRLALVGSEGDPIDSGLTPVTAPLAESIGLVTKANAVFPRGIEFPRQIERSGFREDWDALDDATRTLEGHIADDHRLGLGVSATATTLAEDARSRLTTLRRFAGDHGQAWARGAA